LAHKLKRTENVLNGNEMRETEIKVLSCKTIKIQKQMVVREIKPEIRTTEMERNNDN